MKIAGRLATGNLDERLIEEVAKRVREVRGFYQIDKAAGSMEGIVKTLFAPRIEKRLLSHQSFCQRVGEGITSTQEVLGVFTV